ncbi:MAG: hypothetical protein JSU01_09045 [Bacteroidetes bacterium]|nr:hypothetical protein [Bacteroidota bacterium]
MKNVVKIQTFNPYASIYPNAKLIDRETLILIKYLKSENYDIHLLPDDGLPVQYLFKKGLTELLSNPIIVFISSIPAGIIASLTANYIQKLIDLRKPSVAPVINITNFYVQSPDQIYNGNGEIISVDKIKSINKQQSQLENQFKQRFNVASPYIEYPIPIFLEHNPYIVGWCYTYSNDHGMKLDGRITDKLVYKRIQQGRYKGLSVTGICANPICSICNLNYIECLHIAGTEYNGQHCAVHINQADYVEVSIVKEPVNSECLVNLK